MRKLQRRPRRAAIRLSTPEESKHEDPDCSVRVSDPAVRSQRLCADRHAGHPCYAGQAVGRGPCNACRAGHACHPGQSGQARGQHPAGQDEGLQCAGLRQEGRRTQGVHEGMPVEVRRAQDPAGQDGCLQQVWQGQEGR
ncbi:hypothetical protein CBM2600_A50012 [Cupriavidus taiwanensis]|nr:hypothetical protein CBM2600_A50012 [Cupriavidus taiwanensis]